MTYLKYIKNGVQHFACMLCKHVGDNMQLGTVNTHPSMPLTGILRALRFLGSFRPLK